MLRQDDCSATDGLLSPAPSEENPYAPDPVRLVAAACAERMPFVQQQQSPAASEQYHNHCAARIDDHALNAVSNEETRLYHQVTSPHIFVPF